MKSRIHLVAMIVTAVLAGSLVPAAATSPAAAQEQTSWYVNDNPDLNGPSQYWYRGDAGRGYGSNNYRYTYGIAGESSPDNWARWSMGRRVGRQEIEAYVPNSKATATVLYRIDVGGREYTRRVAQRNAYGWTSLGTFNTDGARVTITVRDNDASQHHDRHGLAASRIGVDAIRMRCTSRCGSSSTAPQPPAPPPAPPAPQPPAPQPPSPSQRSSSSPGCGVVSLGTVGGNSVSRSGEWSDDCTSGSRSGRFARRFEFSVSAEREVTIDLESDDADPFLLLISSNNRQIASDDDGGSDRNSRITRTLAAGTYRVEATTYSEGEAGRFTLGVSAETASSAPVQPPPPPQPSSEPQTGSSSGCGVVSLGTVGGNSVSRSGEWSDDCTSGRRSGRFARLFEFALSGEREVTIDLESAVDTYLFLLDGQNGVIESDDDGGSGLNSQITRTLAAGAYRVEATTFGDGETGSFTLRVAAEEAASAPPPPPAPQSPPPSSQRSGSSPGCGVVSLGTVGGNSVSRAGEWSDDCTSGSRSGRFARLFEFSVSAEREVTIDLESAVDPFLFLLDSGGGEIARDDDGGSDRNSRITRTLTAGTYRLEATTYGSGTTGSFDLTITAASARSSSPTPVVAVGDDARPSGRCSSAACRWLRISNLQPGSRVECWREGMQAAYGSFTASSATSTRGCYFSYVGARVYVVADGVRSNTITWPSAPAQLSEQQQTESSSGCDEVELGEPPGGGEVATRRVLGQWSADCSSSRRNGAFARKYGFELFSRTPLVIDLASPTDTYLYLLDSRGRVISENDDGGSGTGSRMTITLSPGSYGIEATTYSPGMAGEFTLRVADASARSSSPTPDVVFEQVVDNPPRAETVEKSADDQGVSRSGPWNRHDDGCGFWGCSSHYYLGGGADIEATWHMGDLQGQFTFSWKNPKDRVNNLDGRPIWKIFERRHGTTSWRLVREFRPSAQRNQPRDQWRGYASSPMELDGEVKIVVSQDPDQRYGSLGIKRVRLRHVDVLPEHRQAAIDLCKIGVRSALSLVGGVTLSIAAAVLVVAAAPAGASAVSGAISTRGATLLVQLPGVATFLQTLEDSGIGVQGFAEFVASATTAIVSWAGNIYDGAVDSYQQGCRHYESEGWENIPGIVRGYGIYADDIAEVSGRRT